MKNITFYSGVLATSTIHDLVTKKLIWTKIREFVEGLGSCNFFSVSPHVEDMPPFTHYYYIVQFVVCDCVEC